MQSMVKTMNESYPRERVLFAHHGRSFFASSSHYCFLTSCSLALSVLKVSFSNSDCCKARVHVPWDSPNLPSQIQVQSIKNLQSSSSCFCSSSSFISILMAETKEGYLNQSYYGPTIPPQQPNPPRPIPSSMRQNLQGCTPYSLICMAFKIITIVLIVIGAIALVLWLIYQPSALKVYVESANLTRFDLLPNNTLYFNFTATLSVRNPNEKVGIYYKHVQATAFYSDAKLGDIVLPLFHQPKKNTTMFDLSYSGPPVTVAEAVNTTYTRERGEGWFWLSLKFYTKVRLRMIVINSVEYMPEGDCSLRLPLPANATSAAAGFERTGCHVDEFT